MVIIMLFAGAAQATGLMDKLGWLYGAYRQPMGKMTTYESWAVLDENHWQGRGSVVNAKGDTVFRETLQLVQQADAVWYIATVADQNGGQPVRFRATTITDSSAVFINPAHDFPQMIVYNKSAAGITVTIEGKSRAGKTRREVFEFARLSD